MTLHHKPNQTEQSLARTAQELLAKQKTQISAGEKTLTLSPELAKFLGNILMRLGNGESVTVFSEDEELTTQQAADILRVSRPYLIKLLDERKIPYRTVGKHRRIALRDLLIYQKKDLAERQAMLNEMTELAQEIDPY